MSEFSSSQIREIKKLICKCCPGNVLSGISTDLISSNLIYEEGILIIETDTQQAKLGDGVTNYVDLPYVLGA